MDVLKGGERGVKGNMLNDDGEEGRKSEGSREEGG